MTVLQGWMLFTVFCWVGCPARAEEPGALAPADLRCEYTVDPLGIDERSPRLSWIGKAARTDERQSAYQVMVASTRELLMHDTADRWDSGKVLSDESGHVIYSGQPLGSRSVCFWKVRLWDRDGRASSWTQPAIWTMGLLETADWQARWIDGSDERSQRIIIRRAVYESLDGKKFIDVAALLTEYLQGGERSFAHVGNALMKGDPAPEQKKQLRLDYEQAGQPVSVVVAENAALSFARSMERPFYLRKTFTPAPGDVTRATLYVTALGLYKFYVNHDRVGDHILAPDWTDYGKRVRYQTYDVTSLVRSRPETTMAAEVANGWYSGHIGNGGFQQYGQIPALLAQLEIVYADGHVQRMVTDGTWERHDSPILSSDFMLGEAYDARQATTPWDPPGVGDQPWTPAHVREEKSRALDAQVAPPVRKLGERQPIKRTEPAPGKWVFDLGQNMVGVVRLKVRAPSGTKLTLRHAEMLNPDGTVYTANLRRAASLDTYICDGSDAVWQPSFTFHGFRYVELSGLPGTPADDAVTGIVLGSDTPRAGTWTCSDPRLNQLMSNIEWGQRGNYLSVPTDCPQRDERLGWMGDAQVFVRTATDISDVAGFFTKWLVDVDDAQTPAGEFTDVSPQRGVGAGTPAWGDAGVICPWTIYEAYGDRRILERHLPAMTKWVDWCREHSTDLLRDHDRGHDYGDWLAIGAKTPKDVIGTAYFAYSTHLLAKAYEAAGHRDEAEKYGRLFEDVRAAFDRAYVTPDGRVKGDTQCVYAMALKFDLLPESLRPKAVQFLADDIAAHGNHLTTGFVGVSYLLPVLTAGGRLDTAYALLTQDTFPSWLFSVKQGATTIWERWDGWTPEKGFQSASMNSFNHYSLGSCGQWLYDTVAGIDQDPATAGYRRLVIHPRPGGGLTFVRATRQTMYGEVGSAWKVADGKFTLDVTVPANTTARVILPTEETHDVGSGVHHFECLLSDRK